jgi:hypothetical protein
MLGRRNGAVAVGHGLKSPVADISTLISGVTPSIVPRSIDERKFRAINTHGWKFAPHCTDACMYFPSQAHEPPNESQFRKRTCIFGAHWRKFSVSAPEVGRLSHQIYPTAIRQIGVSEVTYYRWRQEFGAEDRAGEAPEGA